MIVKTVKILRNNWKKSVFFSCVSLYGINYGYNKLMENNKMRTYCEEASRFGSHYIRPDVKCRHITVILNPVANGRKSKALYDKYCAPLLYLAGIRVSLVVTEAEGQTKDLMEIMNNTDGILIAGGNGTVHEAVTGLLRREDYLTAIHRFPIGILPVGRRNTIAMKLNKFYERRLNHYEVLAESTMSAIREVLAPIDVMKIEGTIGRPVYAIDELNCGKIRDTVTVVDKYWYFGSKLKPYFAFFVNSFKTLSPVDDLTVSYSEPCNGCSKCYERFEQSTIGSGVGNQSRDSTTRWWHIFMSRKSTTSGNDSNNNNNGSNQLVANQSNRRHIDYRHVINDKCQNWSTMSDRSAANVLVVNTNECKLRLIIYCQPLTQNQFISHGVKLFNSEPLPDSDDENSGVKVIEAMDINIDLTNDNNNINISSIGAQSGADNDGDSVVADVTVGTEAIDADNDGDDDRQSDNNMIVNNEEILSVAPNNSWLSIDTESYERQSLKITLMPKVVNMYSCSTPSTPAPLATTTATSSSSLVRPV